MALSNGGQAAQLGGTEPQSGRTVLNFATPPPLPATKATMSATPSAGALSAATQVTTNGPPSHPQVALKFPVSPVLPPARKVASLEEIETVWMDLRRLQQAITEVRFCLLLCYFKDLKGINETFNNFSMLPVMFSSDCGVLMHFLLLCKSILTVPLRRLIQNWAGAGGLGVIPTRETSPCLGDASATRSR